LKFVTAMRRFVETAVCVSLALVLVGAWLVEPYSIVSGSMHPTLAGPHRDYDCPACGRRVVLPADVPPLAGRPAYCPHCKSPGPIESELPIAPGDALLVDRTAFARRAPRRWEVIAFHLPGEATKIAVKRVVGLPGETIEVRGTRLFIDGEPATGAPRELDYSLPVGPRGPVQWKLAADEYFVVGDSPSVSDDSRTWPGGAGVASQLIVGKPVIVHAPRRTIERWGRRFHIPDFAAIRYIR
jgi:signal peptidase I